MTRPTCAAASFSGGSTPEVLLPLSDHPLPFIVLATGIDLELSERYRFVFAVKAHRATTHSKKAAQTEAAVARLLTSGITELGDRLGPLLWQFPPYRRFAADTLTAFLDLLPAAQDGVALRHAIEARHASFADPAAVALCRKAGVALIIVDSDKRALLGDLTAPFVYARLRRNAQGAPEGHDSAALNAWAARARSRAAGRVVADLKLAAPAPRAKKVRPRLLQVFHFGRQSPGTGCRHGIFEPAGLKARA